MKFMFRHKNPQLQTPDSDENKAETVKAGENQAGLSAQADKVNKKDAVAVLDTPDLRELIEKNLKWSQIIYEQNRKINNKLLWSAIANWLRMLLIVVPLILAILFLGPLFKDVISQYNDLLGGGQTSGAQQNSMDNLLKFFNNLDPAKQEQLKAWFK